MKNSDELLIDKLINVKITIKVVNGLKEFNVFLEQFMKIPDYNVGYLLNFIILNKNIDANGFMAKEKYCFYWI